jgi:hypothetical protein
MYAATDFNLNHFVHESQRADVIMAGHRFYVALRDKINYWVAYLLLGISLPITCFLIYYLRRRLQKNLPAVQLTTDNYSEMRQMYTQLAELHEALNQFAEANLRQQRFFIKIVLKEVLTIRDVIGKVVQQLKNSFDILDESRPKSRHNLFEPISGETLWKGRPQGYAYRL